MAKCRFCYLNLALDATITASASVTNHPASYLANVARWKKWRSSTTTGDQNVVFDFGGAQTIKAIVLVDWKRHSGGTIKAQYWDGAAWQAFGGGTGLFTLPSFNPTRVVALWDTTGVSTTKIRILFTNTGAVSDYVELGVVFAGTYLQPTYNLVDGFKYEPVDPSVIVRAQGGQEESQVRDAFHLFEGGFEHMPEADLDSFRALFAEVGFHTPIVLAVDPEDVDEILYARVTGLPYQQINRDSWDFPISAQEVL